MPLSTARLPSRCIAHSNLKRHYRTRQVSRHENEEEREGGIYKSCHTALYNIPGLQCMTSNLSDKPGRDSEAPKTK